MERVLRILYLEDDPLDAEMVLRLLEKDGLRAEIDRVDTFEAFRNAISQAPPYALIIADYSLPGVDPQEALKLAKQMRPELPFIFLTGTVGEETAIEMLKLGANDYVLKQRILRFAHAVRRALREAEEQTLRKQVEQDLIKTKEAAEEANRAKSEFLAKMSHELRTPMTVILGYIELMRSSNLTAEQNHFLTVIDSSARRLLSIIDDVLDIARIETHRLKIEERPFDQGECVRLAVEIFAVQAQEKGLHLHWTVDPRIPALAIGDPDRIGQVLVNLIGNAVKFTSRGEIAVTVAPAQDGQLLYAVRDTGIGIHADELEQLFQPFTQVDSSLSRRFGGIGLGLAICRELVELMGGKIWVKSVEGEGSTFFFTLPLRPADPDAMVAAPVDERMDEKPRILLAEDDPQVRELIGMLLRRNDWHVVPVENGREAVSKWQEGGIDLILMDIQMPVLDGLDATREIRAREAGEGGHTPIIALTAHARHEDRKECQAAGMDGFISKPVNTDELRTAVTNCLAGNCHPR